MPASRTPHFQCLERSSAYRYHPIHNVPFEVLAIILHWAMREDVHIPATALQVSRLWRYISVHSPQLWSRLALTPNWELWQSRIVLARASQLEVELRSDAQRGQSLTAASAQYAMHVALPYIHRWRSLDINLKDYSPYLLASTISGCCSLGHTTAAPQLEELSLHYPLNDDPKEFALFSGYAPRLHRLSVSGVRLVWSSSLYANLTYLDYTHHPFTNGRSAVAEVLHMLRISSKLEQLQVSFPRRSLRQHTRHRRVGAFETAVLPSLRHFSISFARSSTKEVAYILGHLSAPRLSSIEVLPTYSKCSKVFPARAVLRQPIPNIQAILETIHVDAKIESKMIGLHVHMESEQREKEGKAMSPK